MRNLLMLSAAASVIALGISAHPAAALSPGASGIGPEGLVQKVQKGDEKGPGARGQDGGGKGADPRARDGGGKGAGAGAAQDKDGNRGAAKDKGDRGAQTRSGDKGARGGQQRTTVDVNVDRGRRGDRDNRRTRVDVDVDRRRRSGVGTDVRGYGYSPVNCQDLLRRYRQCVAR
jgi:hypothetical protein